METKNKMVDAYIEKSPDFAKPILNHLREVLHKGCPNLEEKIKWGVPSFDYKGIICNMAAFKQHCALVFWKASLMNDPHKIFVKDSNSGMGNPGRIKSLKDLPTDKILIQYVKQAVELNEKGIKISSKAKPKKEIVVPSYFKSELSRNKKASEVFENFSYTNKKEYIDWLTDAKTESTRTSRLKNAIQWISEGKIRNWKYQKK